jgi:N-acyl-D-amino-acid deacylase
MNTFDIIIKNGTVVDGTGAKAKRADVGIRDGKITDLDNLEKATAKTTIDASGKVVSPGFIDTHSHSDLCIFAEPYVAPKIRQGVTTELIGQDGLSVAPINDENLSSWMKAMESLEGQYDVEWTWRSAGDYLNLIEELDLGPNIAYLAPHGNIRLIAMGLDDKQATADELKDMERILEQCIEEGAFGISTGMIYPPCYYAKTDEFIALGKILSKRDAIFVTHQRSESDNLLNSMDEILTIGRQSNCRIHFSHFKVAGKKNWAKLPEAMKKLDEAQSQGIVTSFDQYPYIAGSTMMGAILPPWAHKGGNDKLLERLQDPELRKKMKQEMSSAPSDWENFIDFAGLDGIYVTFVKTEKNQELVGKNLLEIGQLRGKDPYEAIFDLLLEEENAVGMVNFYGNEEHVKEIMKRKEHNVCTDGIMATKPHPRLYGTFPRILGRYVREEKVLDIETAIHKMTGKPAEVLGLKDRGILKPGYAADIVVFDPEKIIDTADYTEPVRFPLGIDYVLVNGKILVNDGRPQPQKAGRVLRYQGR